MLLHGATYTTKSYTSTGKIVNLILYPGYFTIATSNFWTVYTANFEAGFL